MAEEDTPANDEEISEEAQNQDPSEEAQASSDESATDMPADDSADEESMSQEEIDASLEASASADAEAADPNEPAQVDAEVAEGEAGPAATEEGEIPASAGEFQGKVEVDHDVVERLLQDAVVGYEDIFNGTALDPNIAASLGEGSMATIPTGAGSPIEDNIKLLQDVNMRVKVELGRGKMYLKDVLRLGQGSVVELERLAGDPLEIYVNEKVIARGEVLVLNENFCIRITEIFDAADLLAVRA